jgi:hypothetical protein
MRYRLLAMLLLQSFQLIRFEVIGNRCSSFVLGSSEVSRFQLIRFEVIGNRFGVECMYGGK